MDPKVTPFRPPRVAWSMQPRRHGDTKRATKVMGEALLSTCQRTTLIHVTRSRMDAWGECTVRVGGCQEKNAEIVWVGGGARGIRSWRIGWRWRFWSCAGCFG